MKDLKYTTIFGKEVSHMKALRKEIRTGLIHIIMDEREISEKAFGHIDEISLEVDKLLKDNEDILITSQIMLDNNKRIKFICETLYDDYFNSANSVSKYLNENSVYKYSDYLNENVKDSIKNLKKLDKEYKEEAYNYITDLTNAKNGTVYSLKLHKDLKKKIKEKDLPSGFNMGIDSKGYFIHTHRARSNSYENPSKITIKDIRFIDSTG